MKPVFKCDYCEQMGTEKEIQAHESECMMSPLKRACCTCCNATGVTQIKCSLGKEIPFMKCATNCPDYIPGGHPEDKILKSFTDLFGSSFGCGPRK